MGPLRTQRRVWLLQGTTACLSALYAFGRHEELLKLIAKSEYRHKSWHNRIWGAKALAASGKPAEAIRYAEKSKGLNAPLTAIVAVCEGVLLDAGFADEGYARFAVEATYATTNLATFKAIVKKYPGKPREAILRDLVASQPGNEGKWFAAAKDSGLFDLAIELANRSPSDPRTLIRAARDFAAERPEFALAAGMTALRDGGARHTLPTFVPNDSNQLLQCVSQALACRRFRLPHYPSKLTMSRSYWI